MNPVAQFYNWLTPPVPFEFIVHFTPQQCASDLASKAGMRWGAYPQRLKVEVVAGDDSEYSFWISLHNWAYVNIEAQGTISSIGDDYAQIAGAARTTPTRLGIALLVYMVIIFAGVTIGLISSLFATNSLETAIVSACVFFIVVVGIVTLNIFSQKWFITMHTDMVVGLLLRIL